MDLAEFFSRAIVGALFLLLAFRIGVNAMETGRISGLLLVASESCVVVLMVFRRPTRVVDRGFAARAITALSIAGPPLAIPMATRAGGIDTAAAVLSAVGLLLVIVSKLTLGRSFGLIPANRGVVSTGPYRLVRHPIYLGYLITHVAFLIANPLAWNLYVLGGGDIALIVRSLYEERTLERDPVYLAYKQRVRWRLLPAVF